MTTKTILGLAAASLFALAPLANRSLRGQKWHMEPPDCKRCT